MTTLFDGYRLGDLVLPNRVVMAPMTRVRAAAGGLATPSMATYYAQRATAGLIVTEGVQPSLIGQSNPGTPGLYTDEQVAAWRPLTAAVHANGGRIFESYAEAARRAVDAGFDGVELHGANGYLISQFLSSNANLRTDRYGGPVANRIRFAVEAVSATVDAVGAARTGIRFSPGGTFWGVAERDVPELYTALLYELARLQVAYVHLEATIDEEVLLALRRAWPGTLIMNPVMPMGPKQTGRSDADHWLDRGADLISFGRAFIANPDLVERLRTTLPITPVDDATYYQGGDAGYLTYPTYQHTA